MAQVKINEVEANISVTDAEALLTPEMLEIITRAVASKIQQQQSLDKLSEQDRGLSEGAIR
jgi:hypothetical protein